MKKRLVWIPIAALLLSFLAGCSKRETVVIYTSMEAYRIEYLNRCLDEAFPQYRIYVEYLPTGNHAAKLLAEGADSECDITHNLDYGYLQQLDEKGLLADLSHYDKSVYTDDAVISDNFLPQERNGGCVILNTEVLTARGLPKPTSYADLTDPVYKGMISMPSPKASGTGYMFLKSLVNAWGEDEAFAYFDELTPNVLQYTSSGSGPLNAVLLGEAAIGLGMTAPTVSQLNEGKPLEIVYFEEGSPSSLYGQSVIKGKDSRAAVRDVFEYLVNTFTAENCRRYFPERIYRDTAFTVENYPTDIVYADMSRNTLEEKQRLLEKWKY